MRCRRDFTSSLEELEPIRTFVGEAASRICLDEDTRIRIELAVNEVACNIIAHAYREQPGYTIGLEISVAGGTITLVFTHRGEPFDPKDVPPPAFDGSRDSGFGLYIVKECMDEVAFDSTPEGEQRVTLRTTLSQSH